MQMIQQQMTTQLLSQVTYVNSSPEDDQSIKVVDLTEDDICDSELSDYVDVTNE